MIASWFSGVLATFPRHWNVIEGNSAIHETAISIHAPKQMGLHADETGFFL